MLFLVTYLLNFFRFEFSSGVLLDLNRKYYMPVGISIFIFHQKSGSLVVKLIISPTFTWAVSVLLISIKLYFHGIYIYYHDLPERINI